MIEMYIKRSKYLSKKLKGHLSSRVVNTNRAKDGGAVIGHFHSATAIAHAPQDLVHSLWSQGGLDKIADGHGADKAGETSDLGLLFVSALLEHPEGVQARHFADGLWKQCL